MSKQHEQQAQPAELSDDAQIQAIVDYEHNPLRIFDEDPLMRYYFAKPDSPDRPDSVEACKLMGYKVSEKKHTSVDCVLMEMPLAFYNKREAVRAKKREDDLRACTRLPDGLEVLPGMNHGITTR